MNRLYNFFLVSSLILVYLVIAAGAIVRMTGSGMGCPDWPKCFGYLIPPTERSQLDWKAEYSYKKGQVIIVNKNLRVAPKNFTSNIAYAPKNWAPYTKHDYAIFNPTHTWIEFLNRVLGAIAGLATLFLLISAIFRYKKDVLATIISFLIVLSMGFQAWLGKTVVDSNLAPYKITVHMVMALLIVVFILYLIFKTKTHLPEPTIKERIQMAEKHLKMAIKWKGEKLGVLETRRHYSNYFRGIPDFKKHKTIMVTSDYSDDIFSLFSDLKSKFKEHELAC